MGLFGKAALEIEIQRLGRELFATRQDLAKAEAELRMARQQFDVERKALTAGFDTERHLMMDRILKLSGQPTMYTPEPSPPQQPQNMPAPQAPAGPPAPRSLGWEEVSERAAKARKKANDSGLKGGK